MFIILRFAWRRASQYLQASSIVSPVKIPGLPQSRCHRTAVLTSVRRWLVLFGKRNHVVSRGTSPHDIHSFFNGLKDLLPHVKPTDNAHDITENRMRPASVRYPLSEELNPVPEKTSDRSFQDSIFRPHVPREVSSSFLFSGMVSPLYIIAGALVIRPYYRRAQVQWPWSAT